MTLTGGSICKTQQGDGGKKRKEGQKGLEGDEASKRSGSTWTREGMRAGAGHRFSCVLLLDRPVKGNTAFLTCGAGATQMAECQSEPLCVPLCGQPWWLGGHRIPNSAELPCPSLVLPEPSSLRPRFQARRPRCRSGVSDHSKQGQSSGGPQTPPGLSSHRTYDISMLPMLQIRGRSHY